MRVAVTGADGFVGRSIVPQLRAAGHEVRRLTRRAEADAIGVGDIGPDTDWSAAVAGCRAVVHLAGLAHVLGKGEVDLDGRYRRVNLEGTLALARQAAAAGVQRLVFLSSSKVNGEGRTTPYRIAEAPQPADPYSRSKWDAERGLHDIAARTGLEVTVIRPPLIYGPGVRANFLRLMRLADRGLPLPLGAVANRRSLVFVGNLGSLIATCLDHPAAAGGTFFVADAEPLSTPQLVGAIAMALGRPAPLMPPLPPSLLQGLARLAGRGEMAARLLDSFALDTSETQRMLGWSPPYSTAAGLAETARWYRAK